MGVGRETTAVDPDNAVAFKAYLMGVGRETTAQCCRHWATYTAYLMGVGRETTALWAKDGPLGVSVVLTSPSCAECEG